MILWSSGGIGRVFFKIDEKESLGPAKEEMEGRSVLGSYNGQVAEDAVDIHTPLHLKISHRQRLRATVALQSQSEKTRTRTRREAL